MGQGQKPPPEKRASVIAELHNEDNNKNLRRIAEKVGGISHAGVRTIAIQEKIPLNPRGCRPGVPTPRRETVVVTPRPRASPKKRKKTIASVDGNESFQQAARQAGVNHMTAREYIRKRKKAVELFDKGLSFREAAKQIRVSPPTVAQWVRAAKTTVVVAKGGGPRMASEKREKIIALREQGLTFQQVANTLGDISPTTARNIVHKKEAERRAQAPAPAALIATSQPL